MSNGAGYVFAPRARRDLRRLDPPVQRRIVEALDRLTADPPVGDVVRLAGVDDEWRLRVGDWRVRFRGIERPARSKSDACSRADARTGGEAPPVG